MLVQMEQGLAIEIVGARIPEGRCFAALSFRGGTACSHFALIDDAGDENSWDGEGGESVTMFESNRAFWYVFKTYISKLDVIRVNADIFLDSAATMIAWDCKAPADAIETLNSLFTVEPDEELFRAAKEEAFREYAAKFTNPLFRFTHKILEQTESAFGFSYEAFTQDFEDVAFDDFKAAWAKLVTPGNALLCLMMEDRDEAEAALAGLNVPASSGDVVAMPVEPVVPLDRRMDITLQGSTLFELGGLCFGPLPELTQAEKKTCLEVVNQHLFGGAGSVSVDLFNASIVFAERVNEDLLDEREWRIEEDEFAACIEAATSRLAAAPRRFPHLFAAEQARDVLQGINNVAIMQVMPRIPFEAFTEKLAVAFDQARQVRLAQMHAANQINAAETR